LALNEGRFRVENPAIFDRIGAEEKKGYRGEGLIRVTFSEKN
jgi:hypothetical protein